MENQNVNNQNRQIPLPDSTAVLVLGILSIVICCGFIGLILGIIALALSAKANALYKHDPGMFSLSSYNNMNAGRICAIIGTVISALWILFVALKLIFVGTILNNLPCDMYQY